MQDNEPINMTYGQLSDMVNRIEQIPPLTGAGAPTSSTPAFHLGQTYIDTSTGKAYYCEAVNEESGEPTTFSWQEAGEPYTAGTNVQINDNIISATDTTYTAGTNVSISNENVISATDTTYSAFTGTDGTAAGTAGLVPAPATTDAGKFLKADGTWGTAAGGGPTVVQTTGQSTTDVMSQKAVTDIIGDITTALNAINNGTGA